MPRHRLRDAVWASLHAKLTAIPGIWKADVAALRRFVEAVVYVLRTGLAWEDLPQRFASGARGGGAEDLGRSRGGLTTKIHALVDRRGRPLCYLLTPGQAADCRHAQALLEGVSFACLIGDRAYDTDALRA